MIKAVVFDAYGTLFDVFSISALAERLYPGQGAAISTLWRDKQIEYTRLISLSDPHNPAGSRHYLPFWELTRLSLRYTLARLKLDLPSANEDALMVVCIKQCMGCLGRNLAWVSNFMVESPRLAARDARAQAKLQWVRFNQCARRFEHPIWQK